jgi:hypothetical protein
MSDSDSDGSSSGLSVSRCAPCACVCFALRPRSGAAAAHRLDVVLSSKKKSKKLAVVAKRGFFKFPALGIFFSRTPRVQTTRAPRHARAHGRTGRTNFIGAPLTPLNNKACPP